MKCEKVKGKLTVFLDNELIGRERADVEKHLSLCTACAKEARLLSKATTLFTAHKEIEPSKDFRVGVWKIIEQETKREFAFQDILRPLLRFPVPATIAAILVIGLIFGNIIGRPPLSLASDVVVKIEGMMCGGCAAKVKRILENVEGVKSVLVDADKGSAKLILKKGKSVRVSELTKALKDSKKYALTDIEFTYYPVKDRR